MAAIKIEIIRMIGSDIRLGFNPYLLRNRPDMSLKTNSITATKPRKTPKNPAMVSGLLANSIFV